MKTTTILGQTYSGTPGMNTVALHMRALERQGKARDALNYLRATNAINKACGAPPHDLQADMTDLPMEGVEIYSAGRAA